MRWAENFNSFGRAVNRSGNERISSSNDNFQAVRNYFRTNAKISLRRTLPESSIHRSTIPGKI